MIVRGNKPTRYRVAEVDGVAALEAEGVEGGSGMWRKIRVDPRHTGIDVIKATMAGAHATRLTRGIRAQAMDADGRLVDDFAFDERDAATHVRNAPSPGATSSLAIAEYVVDRVLTRL